MFEILQKEGLKFYIFLFSYQVRPFYAETIQP